MMTYFKGFCFFACFFCVLLFIVVVIFFDLLLFSVIAKG